MEPLVELVTDEADYAALTQSAAFQVRPDAGALILAGADRVDFVQRMTSNDVLRLPQDRAAVTVLTSPVARILAVFTVVKRAADLLILPEVGRTADLFKHLRGQIFFMDQVTVTDVNPEFRRLRLMGPQAANVLALHGFELADAPDGTVQTVDGVTAVKQMGYDVPGYEILVPIAQADRFLASLRRAHAHPLADDRAYHMRRVEWGRPGTGAEITDAFSPLEAGLAWACAENKGCYTGQEIIARQITYDKVTKTLVGITADGPVDPGAEVLADGRSVGTVTSAVFSPSLGKHLALAVVKRPANVPGTAVTLGNGAGIVAELPFITE
ncbi:MAG: aminomethyltransferase family protein [Caldilineaceae bacterium]|nr:aminomethyltransferase family protein [Caldilineaceae bacterium]MBP8106675.1 aminomethyltransferase family protein [Caldilineaceae bacterium]MBP8122185.1 aminomethyltransferase family protein [Caldilineaceae bacterium]MBP9071726.1 aminomethyltransferase family protein [Caldilineaceae bacterium]